jgi:biotin-independent malonate decarboxylase beta subunit
MNERDDANFIDRQSFIELDARERAKALFDAGTSRELLGPFDRVESPWLSMQGVTPQADNGRVVMKGKISGQAAVVVALEGAFQGGSMGEVSCAKLTAALDLACADNEKGIPTSAIMLLEAGGVRLQEANLELAAIAEIVASIAQELHNVRNELIEAIKDARNSPVDLRNRLQSKEALETRKASILTRAMLEAKWAEKQAI